MTEQEEADRNEGHTLAAKCMMDHGFDVVRSFAEDFKAFPSSFFGLGVREFVVTIEHRRA